MGERLDPNLAATIGLDGQTITVYGSHVLLGYVRDEPEAAPQGHSISTYGGWWLLINPDGTHKPGLPGE